MAWRWNAVMQALGICLEEYEYPYPVRFLPLSNDLQPVQMAYMDVPPSTEANGQTVVLFHGKAFGCYYHVVPLGQYAKPADAARLGDFVVVPECGHIPHLEQPRQFLGELLPFLSG
jgi:hypothetical protein